MGINTRDRGRYSAGGIFHIRGGSVSFGTSLANGGKGDIIMYRKATDELALDGGDSFTIPGSATVGGALLVSGAVRLTGDITSTGNQNFGAGGTTITFSAGSGGTVIWAEDVNLYWDAAGVLKSDDNLTIQGELTASTAIPSTLTRLGANGTKIVLAGDSGGTLTFQEDTTNLYWSAAGIMKTDAQFDASTGGIFTINPAGAVAAPSLSNNGELQITVTGGTPRLYARIFGTTFYFDTTG